MTPLRPPLARASELPTLAPPPAPGAPVAEALAWAEAELRAECARWAQGLRQDAAESAPRIPWLRQVSRGVRVPVHALYFVHSRRRLEAAARRLVERAAQAQSAQEGRSAARLTLLGQGLIELPDLPPSELDITVQRGFFEAEVAWRRRFEAAVVDITAQVTEQVLVAHLRAVAAALEARWSSPTEPPALLPAPDRKAS